MIQFAGATIGPRDFLYTCSEDRTTDVDSLAGSRSLQLLLSDQYTTAMLVSNTVGALPPYPGTFTGDCSAYHWLSDDESSYSIQRFRYKFTFPAATQPFVIHWVERFTPWQWVADRYVRCEPISIRATESGIRELLEPTSNGTITVEAVYVETFDANTATVAEVDPSEGFPT